MMMMRNPLFTMIIILLPLMMIIIPLLLMMMMMRNLLLGKMLVKLSHHFLQLCSGDESVTKILVIEKNDDYEDDNIL